jgi:hypothetical protein
VLSLVTTFRILNYAGRYDTPSFRERSLQAACYTDPQVLKWDENWDPNDKLLVDSFGSKEGLHQLHVRQCIANLKRHR